MLQYVRYMEIENNHYKNQYPKMWFEWWLRQKDNLIAEADEIKRISRKGE